MNGWILERTAYSDKNHLHDAPVNTVGNGLFCCRGFFEEQDQGIAALGGIYMSRVFGRAAYTPWKGLGRELVNVPNFLKLRILVNGEPMAVNESTMADFRTELDIQNAAFSRSYTYTVDGQALLDLTFTRFASRHDIYSAGQKITLTPRKDGLTVAVDCTIDADITNLNDVSCEPWPVQPGKKQCFLQSQTADMALVDVPEPDHLKLAFAQKTEGRNAVCEKTADSHRYTVALAAGETAVIEKMIAVALSPEDGEDVASVIEQRLQALPSYEEAWNLHTAAMAEFWKDSDLVIEGNEEDQVAVRYNILQLMQSCPEHTNRYSIGARGLTGEMYEGSVFWDTEIFMLPFFTMTRPEAARKLLEFRYNTLPEARAHAKSNWFQGAMYGWQVNAEGVEQTPQGVGAYYSIHVISDIAYAILEYWHCTKDEDFLLNYGLEILMETARFWVSRVTLREDGQYDINAVRGPNEYDVLVNNNLYTNMMARENFLLCIRLMDLFEKTHPAELHAIQEKIGFAASETEVWKEIGQKLVLPYNEKMDLWLEDDTYLRRKVLNMKEAKPTAKRIIDTTIPYEALPFYQISKQADVLQVMKHMPWYFTPEQIRKAYEFYQPRTAFDSSLAYSMFALMAARLGRMEEAEQYFDLTAKLDMKNVQLNTISGLHFANFGGTWQGAVFGFGGVETSADGIKVNPHLHSGWQAMHFTLQFRGARLAFHITHQSVAVELLNPGMEDVHVWLGEKEFVLSETNKRIGGIL